MASVSVIMPALNEEKNVENAVRNCIMTFDALKIDGEVVVVNDGSTDKTGDAITRCLSFASGRMQVVTHPSPQGIGASFWDGVSHAAKDAVVMVPGDGENDAREILRYLTLIGDVDIVNPFVVNKDARTSSRNFISGIFLFIINATFGLSLKYTNGTVIYRRDITTHITHNEKGFFYQVEALVKLIKKGYLYAEVPYKIARREGGTSKALTFKSLRNVMRGYLALVKSVYFPCACAEKKP